jgi:hypothetical protein
LWQDAPLAHQVQTSLRKLAAKMLVVRDEETKGGKCKQQHATLAFDLLLMHGT